MVLLQGLLQNVVKIVFVEKSGLRTSDSWEALVHTFQHKICYGKNNQFRHNLPELYIKARQSDKIILNWHNYNP